MKYNYLVGLINSFILGSGILTKYSNLPFSRLISEAPQYISRLNTSKSQEPFLTIKIPANCHLRCHNAYMELLRAGEIFQNSPLFLMIFG